jgi:hypothetical protein
MVASADHSRRVLHYQAAIIRDQDGGVTARCLELGLLCAHGRDIGEALARLRDLVAMELSHRSDQSRPLYAMVIPLDVPMPPTSHAQQSY